MKLFIDGSLNVDKMIELISETFEKIVEKGENAGTSIFSFFHNVFKRPLFRVLGIQDCVLTLSSIYSHFNTQKKKALGKHCGKR